jgi:hypothetical protein
MDRRESYIPALSFDWLTPFYDPLFRWVLREGTYRSYLSEMAEIQPD